MQKIQQQHYSASAYDSTKTRMIIPEGDERWQAGTFSGTDLAWACDFSLFQSISNWKPENIKDFKKDISQEILTGNDLRALTDSSKRVGNFSSFTHDHFVVHSRQNWFFFLMFINIFLTLFKYAGPVLLIWAAIAEDISILYDPSSIFFFVIFPWAGSWLIKKLLNSGRITPNIRAIFFRSTGLVYVYPHKGGKASIKPFTEFNAIATKSSNPNSGASSFDLCLAHRQDPDLTISFAKNGVEANDMYLDWGFLQQFMDISKPLPDVPELELFRHLDPTTAAWDKLHNRPSALYRSMSNATYKKFISKVFDYKKGYIWGKPIQTSLMHGWQPPPEAWWTMDIGESNTGESNELSSSH